MRPTITVDIEAGLATVSTKGFKGAACQSATASLEKALGMKTSDQKTPEFDVKEVRTISG